jgi:N-acylneuraminate cytidylyltransferase
MTILGLIPARGGSKTIVDKNLRPLAGKSLVQRAWETGTDSGVCTRLVVSTDSPRIADHARAFGADVPFLRPENIAGDTAPMIAVALHALEQLGHYDAVLLLQPPSPLRTAAQLQQAVALLENDETATAVCSVAPMPLDQCPHYLMKIENGHLTHFLPEAKHITRRQDVRRAYFRDGGIFLTRTEVLKNEASFYGDRCLPLEVPFDDAINIDEPRDWELAEARLSSV